MTDKHYTDTDDRRAFFRVEDSVQLHIKHCTREQFDTVPCSTLFEQSALRTLLQDLKAIDYEHAHILRAIAEESRSLEQYLKATSKKIELVASHLCASLDDPQKSHHRSIILSEGGLAFLQSELMTLGELLAMELILFPSYSCLYLYGEVISCIEGPGKYRIGVNFAHLKDLDRQTLAKQVMHCQLQQKRQQLNDQD